MATLADHDPATGQRDLITRFEPVPNSTGNRPGKIGHDGEINLADIDNKRIRDSLGEFGTGARLLSGAEVT
jgi:hypothetical protein